MIKKTGILFLFLLLWGLPGCSQATSGQEQETQIIDISSAETIPISIAGDIRETEALLEKDISVKKEVTDSVKDGDIGEKVVYLETVIRNTDYEFYQISYSELMAQYSYRNQLYTRNLQQGAEVLIYDNSEAYWLNEVSANDSYLYWVEYVHGENAPCYKVMQYSLDSGNVSCIAQRDGGEVSELCLAVSEHFLTWYDIFRDGRVEIVVFDIEKQEFREREEIDELPGGTVTLSAPYVRLKIVEDCITYFLEDAQEQLYIRRENLNTGQKVTLLLGDKSAYSKLAGCFSDGQYIGWHTDYGWGSYYFYHMDDGKLYSWDVKKDGMYVFSKFFSNGKFYFYNSSEDNGIYVWDLSSGQTYRQGLGDGRGMQFEQYGEELLALEVQFEDRVELVNVCGADLP